MHFLLFFITPKIISSQNLFKQIIKISSGIQKQKKNIFLNLRFLSYFNKYFILINTVGNTNILLNTIRFVKLIEFYIRSFSLSPISTSFYCYYEVDYTLVYNSVLIGKP